MKTAGTVTLTQDYLGEIELNNNVVEAVYNEEGRAVNNAGTFRYEYTLKDHLGNTRLVFSDKNGSGSIDNSEIISETHYYPFGKVMNGAWSKDPVLPKFRYLYNGKELNEEFGLNFYDYGARWYDAGMGSWWEVDPLADKQQQLEFSPYVFSNNNPIRFTDPDGRLPFDWIKLQNGSVTFDPSVNNQAQATAKYGNGATDIGKSGAYMNEQGEQVNLNANGTATSSTMLSEVTVTGKSGSSLLGTLDNLTDAVDLSNNLNTSVVGGASKLGNALDAAAPVINVLDDIGKGLGITGAVISTAQAIENPTAGNLLKAGVDIGLAALKVNPLTGAVIGIADGLLSVTGAKDAIFKAVDNKVEQYQSNKIIESQQVDISKIRIR